MKQKILFVHIIFYFLSLYSCTANDGDLTLELVQVIFRHGARTPSQAEAFRVNVTDPTFYWPECYYQLTNEGKQQAYVLGTVLRKKYGKFLGTYNPQEYNALSTGFSRTIMSLQLALAGLFPPSPKDSWNNKLIWKPVPFYQNLPELDIFLAPHQTKKYLDLYFKTIADSTEFQQKLSKYTEFIELMQNKTGFPFKEDFLYNVGWTYYAIKYHKAKDLPLPNWYTDDSIYITLMEALKLAFDGMSWTPQLKRLNGGTLVRKIIENINDNRKSAIRKKIYLYSTHDLTLYGFSKAQDFDAFYLPPFGSALIMEKYTDSQKSEYVKMLAWDPADGENFRTVKIGNCDELCPFEDYLKIVRNNTATDEDLEYLRDETNKGTSLNV